MDVPVPQVLEEIVALVACRRQATARVGRACQSGGLCLAGGRMAAPPGGHSRWLPRSSTDDSADIVAAGPSGVNKHAIHDYVCLVCGKWFRSSRWDGGCGARVGLLRQRAAWTSLLEVLLVFTSLQDTRHDAVRFFWSFPLLSISLFCCLFCVVSRATKILFFRSASRWSCSELKGKRILRFPFPRLLFNGAQFHSPEVRGFPRLLCGEQFVQQSR